MTEYLNKTFSVMAPTSQTYRDNWDQIFAKPDPVRAIFDRVKTHLLTQNRRAASDAGCRYRTGEGLSCAVGCLIADEHYDEREMEFTNIGGTAVYKGLSASGIDMEDPRVRQLLRLLQVIHDSRDTVEWPRELDELEENFFGSPR